MQKKATMSTMGLTPGTPLMAEIERSLEFYICQRLQRFKYLKYELSGARVEVSMHSMSSKTMLMLVNVYSISKANAVFKFKFMVGVMQLPAPAKAPQKTPEKP